MVSLWNKFAQRGLYNLCGSFSVYVDFLKIPNLKTPGFKFRSRQRNQYSKSFCFRIRFWFCYFESAKISNAESLYAYLSFTFISKSHLRKENGCKDLDIARIFQNLNIAKEYWANKYWRFQYMERSILNKPLFIFFYMGNKNHSGKIFLTDTFFFRKRKSSLRWILRRI